MHNTAPKVGDLVRWRHPGSVVLSVSKVAEHNPMYDAWPVMAGGWLGYVQPDGRDGIPWKALVLAGASND